jgi:hypothetical protein
MTALEGSVDRQFVRPLLLGDNLLPYRLQEPLKAILPWDGKRLLRTVAERAMYPGLADWWTRAEEAWNAGKSKNSTMTLFDQIDYRSKLTNQLPLVPGGYRVVYNKSGMYLAGAIVSGGAVIDHKLYWASVATIEEARYLEAILNSSVLTDRLRPLQARGEHNPRDYDLYVWEVPIPEYDSSDERHTRLTDLATQAEAVATSVILPAGKRFETHRRIIRQTIAATEVGRAIEREVASLLAE